MIALLWRGVAAFTPGGWIASIAVAVGRFVVKWLYALCADISDAFKDPMRFVVRTTFGVAILLLGVHLGMDHMREERDEWRNAHRQLIKDADIKDKQNAKELSVALKAKADAEAALLVRKVRTAPVGPAAGAKRVQPKRAAGG